MQFRSLHRRNGTGHGYLFLRTCTDYHYFRQHFIVRFQFHIGYHQVRYIQYLLFITDIRKFQLCLDRNRKAEVTVQIGRSPLRGTFQHDGHTDKRFSGRAIRDITGNGPVFLLLLRHGRRDFTFVMGNRQTGCHRQHTCTTQKKRACK